jgi:hypothetical protein
MQTTLIFVQSLRGDMTSILVFDKFAGVVARVEGLRGHMSEAGRQVEGLLEALLNEAFTN